MTNKIIDPTELRKALGAFMTRVVGISQTEAGKYMDELIPAVQSLWAGDYAHNGECYRFPEATSEPKPLQQPHPPIWVAARGPATYDLAVAHGCNVMGTPLSKPDEEVADLARKFNEACANHPEVKRPQLMITRQTVALEHTDDWRPAVDAFVEYGRHFENLFKNIGEVRDGFTQPAPLEDVVNRDDYQPETIHKNQMIGSPDEIIPRLQRYAELGVDQYCFQIDNGMPYRDKKRSLELFIHEVMPEFGDAERIQSVH